MPTAVAQAIDDADERAAAASATERSARRERLALFLLALNTLFLIVILALQLRGPRAVAAQRF